MILALALSMAVLIGWPVVMNRFFPPPPEIAADQSVDSAGQPPGAATGAQGAATQGAATQSSLSQSTGAGKAGALPTAQTTVAAPREVVIETPYYRATLSNRGAVATSWILKRVKTGETVREIKAANGGPLELIPQNALDRTGAPLRLHIAGEPELAQLLNTVNFQIEGIDQSAAEINLQPGESRQITFTYASPNATARKSFTFFGDRLIFDVAAGVSASGGDKPAHIVIGPRIGDQTDHQSSSYSTPPQVVAYTMEGSRQGIIGSSVTPVFAKITQVDHSANEIEIDKPLAADVDDVKVVAADGHTFLGYAQVTERKAGSRRLVLDRLPEGAGVGSGVAQGTDTLRHPYRWAGVVDHYFAMVAVPPRPVGEIALTDVQLKPADADTPLDYPSVAIPVEAGAPTSIFVGPKDPDLLASVASELNASLDALIDYGMFAWMIRPIVPLIGWALDSFSTLFHNYGWSIVAVTVIINLMLSPLRWYSSKKMKKAAKHQPRMKELQDKMKKFKENPKKYERELQDLQREQMELMKEANPLGGCLPLLLQMPIFWAFFVYLSISLDVRQAPWLFWVRDLSSADPYYVLPIIMCVTMIASTKLTPQPATADPSMKMQRVMMTWLMPIMLTWFFFFSAPSGLVLYWMVSNLVGVIIQLAINKFTAEPEPAVEVVEPSKGGKNRKSRQERRGSAEA